MGGFKKFLLRGNVVDLAVGVIIGAAFGAVVTALTKGIITPFIGMFGGVPDFAGWVITVNGSTTETGTVTLNAGAWSEPLPERGC